MTSDAEISSSMTSPASALGGGGALGSKVPLVLGENSTEWRRACDVSIGDVLRSSSVESRMHMGLLVRVIDGRFRDDVSSSSVARKTSSSSEMTSSRYLKKFVKFKTNNKKVLFSFL